MLNLFITKFIRKNNIEPTEAIICLFVGFALAVMVHAFCLFDTTYLAHKPLVGKEVITFSLIFAYSLFFLIDSSLLGVIIKTYFCCGGAIVWWSIVNFNKIIPITLLFVIFVCYCSDSLFMRV